MSFFSLVTPLHASHSTSEAYWSSLCMTCDSPHAFTHRTLHERTDAVRKFFPTIKPHTHIHKHSNNLLSASLYCFSLLKPRSLLNGIIICVCWQKMLVSTCSFVCGCVKIFYFSHTIYLLSYSESLYKGIHNLSLLCNKYHIWLASQNQYLCLCVQVLFSLYTQNVSMSNTPDILCDFLEIDG